MSLSGYDLSRKASEMVYASQIDVCELHDCFSANELVTYDDIKLCERAKLGNFLIREGLNTYVGKLVVNPIRRINFKRTSVGSNRPGSMQ